ncbi:MAG: hypothetical protein ACRCYD_05870, partial [Plesiomonas sp.]
MATREEALAELYSRGALNDQQKSAVEELSRRGIVKLPESVDTQIQKVQQENIPFGQQVMHDLSQVGKGLAQAGVNIANIPAEIGDILKGTAAEVGGWLGIGDSTYQPLPRLELPEGMKPTDDVAKMGAEIIPYLIPIMGPEKAAAAVSSAAKTGRMDKLATWVADLAQESIPGALAQTSGQDQGGLVG